MWHDLIKSLSDLSAMGTELVVSIITAMLTAAAIFLVRLGVRVTNNRLIQKKYPLGGDYITYYQDEVNAQPKIRKATLRVTQHGRTFVATNRNLDDHREWKLRGDILQHGYVAGTFGTEDPNDPSKGTYFLEPQISRHGEYSGHWSGYDSANRKIASGSYVWRRLSRVKVRTLDASSMPYLDKIMAIFAASLGEQFIAREELAASLQAPRAAGPLNGQFVQGAFVGKELVAVRTASVLSPTAVSEFEVDARKAGATVSLRNYKVGKLAQNAVRPDHRRMGIGSQMVSAGVELLRQQGCTACVAVSWDSKSLESSATVLEAFGFRRIATALEYWKMDSVEKGFHCPKCGVPPCLCAAGFYMKTI
jgi:GNAT superfamily N-acetyltransferase